MSDALLQNIAIQRTIIFRFRAHVEFVIIRDKKREGTSDIGSTLASPNRLLAQEQLRAVNADSLSAARDVLKFDNAVDERVQRVVSADADILAGMYRGSALSYDDVAGFNSLTVGLLHAQTLSFAVASVL